MTAVIGDRPTLAALSLSWHEVPWPKFSGCLSPEIYIRMYRKSLLSADKIPDHVFANFARLDTAAPTIIVSSDLREVFIETMDVGRGSRNSSSVLRVSTCTSDILNINI